MRLLSFPHRALIIFAMVVVLLPASASAKVVGDHGPDGGELDPARNQPIPCDDLAVPLAPRSAVNIAHVANFCGTTGTDIEMQSRTDANGKVRDYVFTGTIAEGIRIYDVTNPAKPILAGKYRITSYQGDIQVRGNLVSIAHDGVAGDNTTSTCLKNNYPQANGQGIDILHLAYSPRLAVNPSPLSMPFGVTSNTCVGTPPGGAHTQTIHPTSRYIAVSNPSSDWAVDIVDTRAITVTHKARHQFRLIDESRFSTTKCPAGATFKCIIVKGPNGKPPRTKDNKPAQLFRPHDVSFSRDGNTMYVAALNSTFIMDVSVLNRPLKDIPANPSIPTLSIIYNRQDQNYTRPETSNDIFLSHQADTTPDGKILVVSDEKGGGVQNTDCNEKAGDRKLIGALHFYALAPIEGRRFTALASPRNPIKLGIYVNPQPVLGSDVLNPLVNGLPRLERGCTVHVFRIGGNGTAGPGSIEARFDGVSKLGGRRLITGWYGAGVWDIDFRGPKSDSDGFKEDAQTTWGNTLGYHVQPGADVWSAKEYKGYIYAGDLLRGFDVYKFKPGCRGALCGPVAPAR